MNPVIALVNSRMGPPLGMLLARVLPRTWATGIADGLAHAATRSMSSPVVRAIRANQAVVRGMPYEHPLLERAVIDVTRYAARGYLAFYRALSHGRIELQSACRLDPALQSGVNQAMDAGKGVVLASAHMGNFDLAFYTLLRHNLSPLVLSYRNPHGSYRADNAIRRHYGLESAPIAVASLREALRRLRAGGLALTGVDRPDSQGELLRFFGRTARLPIGHARLAVKTGAVVQAGVTLDDGQGGYRMIGPPPLEPPTTLPGPKAALALAQKVLEVLEGYIRDHPAEWLMFFPVWPETIPQSSP
jgi:KDO2-lipid IV(A) lauroyltransferase